MLTRDHDTIRVIDPRVVDVQEFTTATPRIPWACTTCSSQHPSGTSMVLTYEHPVGGHRWTLVACRACVAAALPDAD